jgi:membrane fusion protein, multidrug efflux system
MKRIVIFSLVLLLLVGIVGGFAFFHFRVKPEMIQSFMSAGGFPASRISAEPAATEDWIPTLPAIGTLRAVQGIDLAPQVGGIVRAIHFESGERVEAGSLLVELDDEVEQADLKSTLAQLQESNLDLGRQQELFERGNTAQASLDASVARRETAAAAVERIRALIDQKALVAPFSGLLGIRNVNLGEYVSPGTPLVALQQLDPIYADFPLPEQNLGLLAIGQDVEIRIDAYPGEIFTGQIESIDARIDQETRSILVRTVVGNADQRLLPGMFANVNVLAGNAESLVVVPRTAISYSLYGDSIYVVVEQPGVEGQEPMQVAERRFVRVGEARGSTVAVLDGIEPGEIVVTSGQLKLRPGAPVVVDNSVPLVPETERPEE